MGNTIETVHFCGLRRARSAKAYRVSGIRTHRLFGTCFVIGLGTFVLAGTLGAGKRPALLWAGGVPFLVATIAAIHGSCAVRRFKRFDCDQQTHHARLSCVGPRGLVVASSELANLPFEPEVFRAPFVMGYSAKHWTVTFASVVVFFVVLVWSGPGSILGRTLPGFGYFYMMTTTLGVFYVMDWLSPTYLRIVPGHLDVMEFGVFLRGRARVTEYDLRTAKVVVDLRQLAVFIDDEKKKVHAELAIAFVRDKYRLAYYVLLAALSTHEPGPLPDDALVG